MTQTFNVQKFFSDTDSKPVLSASTDTKSSPAISYTYTDTKGLPPFNQIKWISSEWLGAISTKPATRGAFLFNPHRPERRINIPLNSNEFILDILPITEKKIVIRKLYQAKQNQKPREGEQIDYFQTFVIAEIISTESGLALKNLHEGEYCCSPIYSGWPPTEEGMIIHHDDKFAVSVLNNCDIMFYDRSGQMHKLNVDTLKVYSFPHFKTLLADLKERREHFSQFPNGTFLSASHYSYTDLFPSSLNPQCRTTQICVRPLDVKGECITIDTHRIYSDFRLNPQGFLYLYDTDEPNSLRILKPRCSNVKPWSTQFIPADFFNSSVMTYGNTVVFVPAETSTDPSLTLPPNIYLWNSLNHDENEPIPVFSKSDGEAIFPLINGEDQMLDDEDRDLKRNFKTHIACHREGIVYYAEELQRIYHIPKLFWECYSLKDRENLLANERIIRDELEAKIGGQLISTIFSIVAQYLITPFPLTDLPDWNRVSSPLAHFAEWAVRLQFCLEDFGKKKENAFWKKVLPQVLDPTGDCTRLKEIMQSYVLEYKEHNPEGLSEKSLYSVMCIEKMLDLREMEKNPAKESKEVGKRVESVARYYPPTSNRIKLVAAPPPGFFSPTYSSSASTADLNNLDEKDAARLAAAAPAGSVSYSASHNSDSLNWRARDAAPRSIHYDRTASTSRPAANPGSRSLNWRDRTAAPAVASSAGAAATLKTSRPK